MSKGREASAPQGFTGRCPRARGAGLRDLPLALGPRRADAESREGTRPGMIPGLLATVLRAHDPSRGEDASAGLRRRKAVTRSPRPDFCLTFTGRSGVFRFFREDRKHVKLVTGLQGFATRPTLLRLFSSPPCLVRASSCFPFNFYRFSNVWR